MLFIVKDRALARLGCAVLEGEVDPSTAKQREMLKLDECRKICAMEQKTDVSSRLTSTVCAFVNYIRGEKGQLHFI